MCSRKSRSPEPRAVSRVLVDRAPRVAHRRVGETIEDQAIELVEVGDLLLVKAGEVVPVDGNVMSTSATIDESALTGEPIPVARVKGERVFSGTINAGATFEMSAAALAGDSAYAGIVRLVTAAQTAKAPFVRLADRYALLFLPFTCAIAFIAWFISGDVIRSLAVFVAATPCPLILAAPVAFIAGVARSARRGILIKGRRAARGAGARPYGPLRQDGDADRRRRPSAFDRAGAGRETGRSAETRRLARAGFTSCPRLGDRPGGDRARLGPDDAEPM